MNEQSYLTPEGAKRLKKELEELKGPAREALSKRLRSAIQQGDLSENADYISAKEEQGFLEGRILELENILSDVIIIDSSKSNSKIIEIGSHVTLQEVGTSENEEFYLVGPSEANPSKGMISYESPIGKALLGHKKGDEVDVATPEGMTKFLIINF